MQSKSEIILITSNNMEGNGCKSFLELNMSEWKISLSLLSADYAFDCFNVNRISKHAIVILDYDSFKDDKILLVIQKMNLKGIKTVIYSQTQSAGLILKSQQLLIPGYVSKHSNPEYLLNCINVLELGGYYYDPVFSELMKKLSAFDQKLSPTQKNVFYEVLSSPNKELREIAEYLNISKHSVEVHLSNIYQKAGVVSYQELIRCFSL